MLNLFLLYVIWFSCSSWIASLKWIEFDSVFCCCCCIFLFAQLSVVERERCSEKAMCHLGPGHGRTVAIAAVCSYGWMAIAFVVYIACCPFVFDVHRKLKRTMLQQSIYLLFLFLFLLLLLFVCLYSEVRLVENIIIVSSEEIVLLRVALAFITSTTAHNIHV